MRRSLVLATLFSFTLSTIPAGLVWAAPPPATSNQLNWSTTPQGPWRTGQAADSTWIRNPGDTDSVVTLSEGVTARLSPHARMQIKDDGQKCALSKVQGRVFVRVASTPVSLDTGPYQVQATTGEFLVEADAQGLSDLRVLNGDAQVTSTQPAVLIAGTDRRARAIKRDKVTNRKDNTKGLGRVKPPKPVAKTPPPPTTPPPVTPPPTTPPPPVAPEPTVTQFPPSGGAGGGGGGLLGTLVGVGTVVGITGILIGTNTGGGDPINVPPPVIFPASP